MKIVFIAPFMATMLRGIERIVHELATRLGERGHEVHILYWPGPHGWPYGAPGSRVVLHELPLPRYYQATGASLLYPLYLRRLQPDVVNVFFSWQGEDAALRLWNDPRAALVLHLQYPSHEVPHRYAHLARSRVLHRARAVVACSEYVAGGARDVLNRRAHVISNGVDIAAFEPPSPERKAAARHTLGLGARDEVICTVGALEERKGVRHVLEGLARAPDRAANRRYLIVGDGPLRADFERLAAAHNLHGTVRFVGAHPDPRIYYQAADVFAFLSRGEAAPLALLEAMAMGLPVIAARQPPLDEFLTADGGLFVDETDPGAVWAALSSLLVSAPLRAAMGRTNRSHVEQRYTWETMADRFEDLFRAVSHPRLRDRSHA